MSENGIQERDRGILTHRERRYLAGELKLDGAPERAIRGEIRKHIDNTMRDFRFLADSLGWRDRQQVFKQSLESDAEVDLEMQPTIGDAIEFLFLAITTTGDDWEQDHEENHHNPVFERELERGLQGAYSEHDLLLENVNLQLESAPEPSGIDDIKRIRNATAGGLPVGDYLPWLESEGVLDTTDLREFVVAQIDEHLEELEE